MALTYAQHAQNGQSFTVKILVMLLIWYEPVTSTKPQNTEALKV